MKPIRTYRLQAAMLHRAQWMFWLVLAVWAMAAPCPPAGALEVDFEARKVRRDILALYDSRHEPAPSATRLHRLAEMPLNWLGYRLTYRDLNQPLPPLEDLTRYRAIVTWLIEPLANASAYLKWLDGATGQGVRLIAMAEVAPSEAASIDPLSQRVHERLGLKLTDQYVSVTNAAKPVKVDAAMIGFERPLDASLPPFPVMEATAGATVHLSLSNPAGAQSIPSAVVVTSAGGGFAVDGFTIFYDATADRARWILNPFAFFKTALGADRFPVPDVTTLAGRRMYFSHIDGDGWNNISEVEGYRENQITAADVIRREIIEPYPDLPVSVGLIGGDAVTELGGMPEAGLSAARIFALPQVEVASHTYTHPFSWGFFENYDRRKELQLIDTVAQPNPSVMDRVRSILYSAAGKAEITDTRSRYIAGSADLPRSYLKEPFDITLEIKRGLEVAETYAPAGKKAGIYLWSGDTEPFEQALRLLREAGVPNMNGGDTRFDAEFPSVFYVPPISRSVGAERQIYAGNSNENTYTNNWHGPYWGQRLLMETVESTESPRRLKPFNLYYHMYSGEKAAALTALRFVLDRARTEPVIPVKASDYARIADAFFGVEIAQIDPMTWEITNRGALQTLRLDDARGLIVDWARSQGVLGSTLHNGALYIATDPAVPSVILVLREGRGEDEAQSANGMARLEWSRWQVRDVAPVEPCGYKLTAEGYGTGAMMWRGAPSRSYTITARRGGEKLFATSVTGDAQGRVSVDVMADAIEPVELVFACDGP